MYAGLKVTEIFERDSVGAKSSIPQDFFVDAAERLRIVSLVFAIGYLLDWGANAMIRTADQIEPPIFSDFAAICSIGLALSVFVLSRTSMELLHGLSLQTLVEQFGTVPPNRTVYILAQVCRSLEEAHYNGLIHRDIKPANILVCHHSVEYDFVKVLDFGLVRSVCLRETDSSDQRRVVGTPAYMAPEVSTNPDSIDHRADIYSLGCVAYWMLTGSLVFDAQSTMRIIRQHVLEAPAPPSEMSDLNIPPSMDALVLQCLHKDPDHRPQNVREVRQQLLETSADSGKPPWTQERAEGWWMTHRPRLDHQRQSSASTAGADLLNPVRT